MTSSRPSYRGDRHPSRLGAKLGPRLAQVISQAMSDHLRRTAHTRARVAAEGANEFFRIVERERKTHAGPLLEMFLGNEGTPEPVQKLLRFMHGGSGELSSLLSHGALSGALATSLGSGIANLVAPTNQAIMAAFPRQILDPSTLAALTATRIISQEEAERLGTWSGLPTEYEQQLITLAHTFPGLPDMLESWRRGNASENDVRFTLERNGVPGEFIPMLLHLKREHLQTADLALMVLRGIISEEEGRENAEFNGVVQEDFDRLVLATGEPPGLMQLLEAYRRGFIDDARLVRGIKQSRVRDEWVDVVEKLRFEPADTSDALRGVIQGYLSDAEGKQIAEWNGLRPEDWGWLAQVEGNPPAPGQLFDLHNRGVIALSEVEQGLRESHVKDKYIAAMLHLRERLPPERLTMQLVQHGGLSAQRALEVLQELGYHADIAQAIVKSGLNQQTTRDKALAKAEILSLYGDGGITAEHARTLLEALGYHAANVDLIIALADLKRSHAEQKQAIDVVRSAYVARHIERTVASGDLDKIGLPSGQRDHLLELWDVERSAHRRQLTEAQIIKANTLGLLADADTEQRLIDMGYSLDDARILIESEKGRTRHAP